MAQQLEQRGPDVEEGEDSSSSSSSPLEGPRKKARRLPSLSPQPPSSPSCSSVSRPPTDCRVTMYRRRKADERDREALRRHQAEGGSQSKPGGPCDICGGARTLQDGHAYFKGQFFCALQGGPEGQTAEQWLLEQRGPDMGMITRTTAWNLKKRWERESGEENRSNKKQRKPHKIRTCKLCGQPQQKDFGHSQSQGEHFCALYSGKSVQLWLAEKRMGRK